MTPRRRVEPSRAPTETRVFKENNEDSFDRDERETFQDELQDRFEQIEGRHPVLEALKAGRPLSTLYLLKGGEGDIFSALQRMAKERNLTVRWSSREELDRLSAGRLHQGVIAVALAKELSTIDELLAVATARGESPFLLVLDGLEDPQNVGSLVRSAEAAGCHGLIMRERRAAGITPALLKAAAGAWEHLPVAQVVNIARALEELKEAGVWIVGADMSGEVVYQTDLARPLALVIGSEGEGLTRLVRQRCDMLISLPMRGHISSLNAGVAGGALLFEVLRQRSTGEPSGQ